MYGGAPPPPGRLGGGPAVKKSNLKPLHWNKVTRAMQGSLWEEPQRHRPPKVDVESLFSNAPPKKAAPQDADTSEPENVQLINLGKVRNTEYRLKKVLQLPVMLIDAVLAMDDTHLDVERVENTLKYFPTKEEMKRLKNYTGDIGQLSRCEQFFHDQTPKDFKAEVLFVDADPLPSIITTEYGSPDGSETSGYGSADEFFEVEEDAFDIHDPTDLLEDNIYGFDVEPESSQDHMSDDANQKHHVKVDPSPQFVKDFDLKSTIVKDIDSKSTIVKGVDLENTVIKEVELKPKTVNAVDLKLKVDSLEAKLDSLMEEMKSKKGKEEYQMEIPTPPPMYEAPLRPPCQPTPPPICKAPPPPMPEAPPPPPPPLYGAPAPPPLPGGPPPPPLPPGGVRGPPRPAPPPRAHRRPGGPPPPPGRLGGGPVRGRGRGPAVKKSNLKELHWNKVTRAIKGSLWEELQRQRPPELEVSELESLFSNAPPKKAAPEDAESSEPENVRLINLRRVRNTEYRLKKVLQLPVMLIDAVLAMDDTHLDVELVETTLKYFPTKEEMERLKNYTGDIGQLSRCEQFFLELMMVPRMEAKLNVFLFKIQFDYQLAYLKKSLNIVNSTCNEVRKSTRLKEVMKRILYLGNTLNQGTATGAAVGFKLDSLLKLTDTRASNNRMTLMHYLCKLIATKSPALLKFPEDLFCLEAAKKIQLKSLAEEMQTLILGLKKAKQELDGCADDGPLSERFHMVLKEFIVGAEAEVTSLNRFYSIVGKNADGLALYFGEDPARCPFEQAIQVLTNFVRRFIKCHEDNLKLAELERKNTKREAEMEQGNGANLLIQIMGTVE